MVIRFSKNDAIDTKSISGLDGRMDGVEGQVSSVLGMPVIDAGFTQVDIDYLKSFVALLSSENVQTMDIDSQGNIHVEVASQA